MGKTTMTRRAWVGAFVLLTALGACSRDRSPAATGGHTNWLPCDSTAECREHDSAATCKEGYCVDAAGMPVLRGASGGEAGSGAAGDHAGEAGADATADAASPPDAATGGSAGADAAAAIDAAVADASSSPDAAAGTGGVGAGGVQGCFAGMEGASGAAGAIPPATPPEDGPCPTVGLRICTLVYPGPYSTLAECTADGWAVLENPSDCDGTEGARGCPGRTSSGVCCSPARFCGGIGVCDGTRWWTDTP